MYSACTRRVRGPHYITCVCFCVCVCTTLGESARKRLAPNGAWHKQITISINLSTRISFAASQRVAPCVCVCVRSGRVSFVKHSIRRNIHHRPANIAHTRALAPHTTTSIAHTLHTSPPSPPPPPSPHTSHHDATRSSTHLKIGYYRPAERAHSASPALCAHDAIYVV